MPTPFGAKVYMIGSNEKATRYSGVDTRAVLLKLYVLSSLLAGVAAVVMLDLARSAMSVTSVQSDAQRLLPAAEPVPPPIIVVTPDISASSICCGQM